MKKAPIKETIKILKKTYPNSACSLNFKTPWELLVATILSAQCTDERVNKVTLDLFKKYQTVQDYAFAPLAELEQVVRSTGFYKNKAKSIKGSACMIIGEFGGKVPANMEYLLKLHGVARKTANVVLGNGFGVVEGIVVDTHVSRISVRLGWAFLKDPVKIEKDLMAFIPRRDWLNISHLLIDHGRTICTARKARCSQCKLNKICPSANGLGKVK